MSPVLPEQATAAEQQNMYFRLEQGGDNASVWQQQPEELSSFILFATSWQLSSCCTSRLWNTNAELAEPESTTVLRAKSWSPQGTVFIWQAYALIFTAYIPF